jgi:hypothetical protein
VAVSCPAIRKYPFRQKWQRPGISSFWIPFDPLSIDTWISAVGGIPLDPNRSQVIEAFGNFGTRMSSVIKPLLRTVGNSLVGRSYGWLKRRAGISRSSGHQTEEVAERGNHGGEASGGAGRVIANLKPRKTSAVALKKFKPISGSAVQEVLVANES